MIVFGNSFRAFNFSMFHDALKLLPLTIFMIDLRDLLVEPEYLTDEQISIVSWRIEKQPYRRIQELWTEKYATSISLEAINTCLSRSARGLQWGKTNECGADPYLCPSDLTALEDIILAKAECKLYLAPFQVIEEAVKLKKNRIMNAIKFLFEIGCPQMSHDLSLAEIKSPSRSWLNATVEKLDLHIANRRNIDLNRLLCCNSEVITQFFVCYTNLLRSYPPSLIFSADETMLKGVNTSKVVVPKHIREAIEAGIPNMPHISAMCCCSVDGAKLPLFLILTDLKNLPLN